MQNTDGVILQYISKIQYIAKWRKIIVIVPLSPLKCRADDFFKSSFFCFVPWGSVQVRPATQIQIQL